MDELLREFLTEGGEHLETIDAELVRFDRNPGDEATLRNIFRLRNTIKETCGFLGLPRPGMFPGVTTTWTSRTPIARYVPTPEDTRSRRGPECVPELPGW